MQADLLGPMRIIADQAKQLLESLEGGLQYPAIADVQKIVDASRNFMSQVDRLQAQSNHDQDSFIAVLSRSNVRHDLRTPLNIITGYSEMLLEDAERLEITGSVSKLDNMILHVRKLLKCIDSYADSGKSANHASGKFTIRSSNESDAQTTGSNHNLLERIFHSRQPSVNVSEQRISGYLLIVGDEPANRDVLTRQVRKVGHTVAEAGDGQEALAMMHRDNFDAVLLDLLMPKLNGFEVLKRMREDPKLRHLPMIVISALDELDSVVNCIEVGAQDYLTKPVNPVLLNARINSSLQRKHVHDLEVRYLRQIEAERNRVDELVGVIFPGPIAEELKATHKVKPRRHENVAVFFLDLVGFTAYCNNRRPEEVVTQLQELVCSFEEIAVKNRVDKTKTIGDAFMATSGLLSAEENPVSNCVRCGLEMIASARAVGKDWDARVGIHVGPVVAGVVGKRQYLFDVWGDTVNTASRVEGCGEPGSVSLSLLAWHSVEDVFDGVSMGEMPIKGKGNLELFRIVGIKE